MTDETKKQLALELAQRLFVEFHASCFWHWNPKLEITEPIIPTIIQGLCTYGGRKGMLAAAKLQEAEKN